MPEAEPREKAMRPARDEFRLWVDDKLRYCDTDRLGHVNNSNFATFYETGRVNLLNNPARPLAPGGTDFVLARLAIDFLAEVRWPGIVRIGTNIVALGKSSCSLKQAVFQHEVCVSIAESVAVLMDSATRRSAVIPDSARSLLRAYGAAGSLDMGS